MTKKGNQHQVPKMSEKSKSGARNKRAGSDFERYIVQKLKEIGYPNCQTTRRASKMLDDSKVDIVDLDDNLVPLIQCKYTANTPNYFQIKKECPIKDKPFVVFWKKHLSNGQKSPGTVAIVDLDYFLSLIKRNNE